MIEIGAKQDQRLIKKINLKHLKQPTKHETAIWTIQIAPRVNRVSAYWTYRVDAGEWRGATSHTRCRVGSTR